MVLAIRAGGRLSWAATILVKSVLFLDAGASEEVVSAAKLRSTGRMDCRAAAAARRAPARGTVVADRSKHWRADMLRPFVADSDHLSGKYREIRGEQVHGVSTCLLWPYSIVPWYCPKKAILVSWGILTAIGDDVILEYIHVYHGIVNTRVPW